MTDFIPVKTIETARWWIQVAAGKWQEESSLNGSLQIFGVCSSPVCKCCLLNGFVILDIWYNNYISINNMPSVIISYRPNFNLPASDVYEINHMNCGNEIKWRLILARSWVQAPLKSWIFFRLLYAIAYNCVHTCEDQPSFDLICLYHIVGKTETETAMTEYLIIAGRWYNLWWRVSSPCSLSRQNCSTIKLSANITHQSIRVERHKAKWFEILPIYCPSDGNPSSPSTAKEAWSHFCRLVHDPAQHNDRHKWFVFT